MSDYCNCTCPGCSYHDHRDSLERENSMLKQMIDDIRNELLNRRGDDGSAGVREPRR